MILTSALVLLAASALQVAPAPEPTKTSVLPPDCGLTEEQVIELAIPDAKARLADSRAHKNDSLNDSLYEVSIVDAFVTDFGIRKGTFLLAVLDIREGYCNFCLRTELVAIDLKSRKVSAHMPPEDARARPTEDGSSLRLFPVFPDDATALLAYSYWTPNCESCGVRTLSEQWLVPHLDLDGSLTWTELWSRPLSFGISGNRGGTASGGCATVRSLWPRRSYRYEQHNFAGWPDQSGGEAEPPPMPSGNCPDFQSAFSPAVDFVAEQEFNWDPTAKRFQGTPLRWTRIDLHRALTWPFNLPMRELALPARVLPNAAPRRSAAKCVPSPTADLCVEKVYVRGGLGQTLQLRRPSDSTVLRQIPDPTWTDTGKREYEYSGYQFSSAGWTKDGRRCLAIVHLGYMYLPPVLVSLTADGKGDRWEGFITDDFGPDDGFILDLPEPPAKPTKPSTRP